ncbi:hypothetical protein TPHA_0A01370 [Tetrapisispora phaffii CBS 4417]|uniref:STM1-like N-terminal domain-containing protein n=1 Tax=Tetrapisispora phaffii (strain ATCC 24235 / CBS 4417 / NBRC 1672 / NRRL Y-8282 / UCD 70-5) TaxID=1071381 RepID=G8BMU2_TETPH|nr:hypothetical protein TPHA_0A01370 [Tetrapisispora phaffii CBS 4417]CCE61220.1 hypothetical protein TPHA_0A01370 [Tetrapisispora phaffii CBS 4417]
MSNPFDLLGNDVEDANVVVSPPRELVKKNTSSKKADVPPPSANPARANKNRPQATGNDKAFKDKSAGRDQNRRKEAPAPSKRTNNRRATDRQSRSGKVDTQKKVQRGWGDDKKELEVEVEGEADADAELEADKASRSAANNKMSLEDYMKSISNSEFNRVAEVTKVAETLENAHIFVKEEEVLAEATKVKTLKSREIKVKEFLDFDATFADNNSSRTKKNFSNHAGKGERGSRGSNKSKSGNTVQRNTKIDTKNLPSLA